MKTNRLEDIERMTVTNRLPVRLTKDELLAKSRELMQIDRLIYRIEHDRKERMKEYKETLEEKEIHKSKLLDEIESESEQRDVDYTLERDYLGFRVRTIRNDTGEVVGERPMGDHERQRSLPAEESAEEESAE